MSKSQKIKSGEAEKKEDFGMRDFIVYFLALIWIALILNKHYAAFPFHADIACIINNHYVFQNSRVVFQHLVNLAILVAAAFSFYIIGKNIIKVSKTGFLNGLERFVFSESLGFVFIYLYVTVLSSFNLVNRYSVYPVLILPIIYETISRVLGYKKDEERKRPDFKISDYLSGPLDFIVSGILLFILVFNLATSLSPEIFYDSLLFHLGVANQYKLSNGFTYLPYNLFSNMPMAHGMIYLLGLVLKDEIISKLFNYFASVLIVLSIIAFCRRFFSHRTGLWAAAVFYSIFHVVVCAWQAGTEMFLTLFTFLSFYLILLHNGNEKKYLTFSGVFSGMAMALKYTGVYAILINLAILLFKYKKANLQYMKDAALLSLISFALFSPWLIKNYIYVKNPVYPFATNIFGLDKNSHEAGLKNFIAETQQKTSFNFKDWVMLPFKTNTGKIANNEYFTPVFLAILPFAWLLIRNRTEVYKLLYLYFGLFYLLWSFSTTVVRYLMPAFPVGAVIISSALTGKKPDIFKKLVLIILIFSSYASFLAGAELFYSRENWKVFFGYESKGEFLSKTSVSYPCGYYDLADWLNKNTKSGSKALLFGDARTLYYERKILSNSVFDKNALFEYISKSANEDELYNNLKKDSIDFIAFNIAEAIRTMRGYKNFEINEKQIGIYEKFFKKYLREVYSRDIYAVNRRIENKLVVYEISANSNPKQVNYLTEFILRQIK